MGQTMSTVVGYIIVFYLRLLERAKGLFTTQNKGKNYYNNDIIIKDDEHQAGKNIFYYS